MSEFFDSGLLDVATHFNSKALAKTAFIDSAGLDPAAMGGAPPMPPGDPAAMGGAMPPMPPGDPAAMGGAMPPMPPGDPAAMGAGGGALPPEIQAIIQAEVQKAIGAGGGAAGAAGAGGAGGGGIKPKIDVNVEMMQIKKMLAKVIDTLGIQMPAQDMVATPDDLNAMAAGGEGGDTAGNPAGSGAISPPEPMGGMPSAAPEAKAASWSGSNFSNLSGRAAALQSLLSKARNS